MNWHRALLALSLLGLACGQVTSLGNQKGGGNAGQGGAAADAGTGAGFGGGAGAGSSGSGGSSAATSTCDVVPAVPIANPTPEQVERTKLIHDFCTNVVKQCGDASPRWHAGGICSPAELVLGCEQDLLQEYLVLGAACDAEWKKWVICGTNATYDTLPECSAVGIGQFNGGEVIQCHAEKLAFGDCVHTKGPWKEVTGTYTTCSYNTLISGPCELFCTVGKNDFGISCSANPGLPLECSCMVNGEVIQEFDGLGWYGNSYATDCADAAKRAADGRCTSRLACCFQYTNGGKDVCLCGSDPKLLGQPTCQALAEFAGGKVVDICPQYLPTGGNCWPPPCQ